MANYDLLETVIPTSTQVPIIFPEYTLFQHIVTFGSKGSAPGEFKFAKCVSISEDTGHIYVSDFGNNRIQIFSEKGRFLNLFGDSVLSLPYGILVHGDSVYVTDYNHCALFNFSLSDFSLIERVGKKGSGKEEFRSPRQLAISPHQLLYVADTDNNRIQILSCNLTFQNSLRHQTLSHPVDVKVSVNQILVLSNWDNPCVHLFTLSGQKVRSIITIGGGLQVRQAFFFCVDGSHNILISDTSAHRIKVFSPEGDLLHTIGQSGEESEMCVSPQGITISKQTNLVCLSEFSVKVFLSY